MIIDHQVLEHGDFGQREQVVRWLRRFPFGFISDREYTLARRVFREGPKIYGITKVGGSGHTVRTRSQHLGLVCATTCQPVWNHIQPQ
jgi:hypothetical protein